MNPLTQWLERLGYLAEAEALHLAGDVIPDRHPYALEMQALLRPDGAIRAQAVFDVEGVPSVVFVSDVDGRPLDAQAINTIRERLWNQNLASLVVAIEGDCARVLPVRPVRDAAETLALAEATPDGAFSAGDIRSSQVAERLPQWFDAKSRVDRALLDNLGRAVGLLESTGLARSRAQALLGQVLFVSYLEHRGIVSDVYRGRREVGSLHALVQAHDRAGVVRLLDALREDFNGDFLASDASLSESPTAAWAELGDEGYGVLDRFLARVHLASGQGDFWGYDFSFIPVELLSGLYESFLSPAQQKGDAAYYTPRHLATLAVDQVLEASPDPLSETIFDGACGSGILLTTAYRRLIALAQAREGRTLDFAQRRALLLARIFGGDINPMACRVTAFSLYLSLLEGLAPADVLAAQEQGQAKLPQLRGSNLCYGPSADFFGEAHPFAGRRFSLIISNPPWKEASGAATSADRWARGANAPVALRQMATAYSLRALDFLAEGGRLCLILPITQFLGATSRKFVPAFFEQVRPIRLINFGDLQQLLFPSAENTCHVLVGERRALGRRGLAPITEVFDYWVPKADLSLALGRLTLESADRHRLQTQAVQDDPQLLTNYMWGDAFDLSVLARLAPYGTLGDMWSGHEPRWVNRKGIHFEDASREPVDAGPLRHLPYVATDHLALGLPLLFPEELARWPDTQTTVVGLDAKVMAVFDGPRVLYPDGFSREEPNVRAAYLEGPATYKHSIGVIAGPREDAELLRFVALYLRSSFGRYLLMLNCAKMLSERNALHLKDLEGFPFFTPDRAPDPERAAHALEEIGRLSRRIDQAPALERASCYEGLRSAIDAQVFAYFNLDVTEQAIVRESGELLVPSIRPRSAKALNTPLQRPATRQDLEAYGAMLLAALEGWRDRMGGSGGFQVEVASTTPGRASGLAIVRVQYAPLDANESAVALQIDRARVEETLHLIRSHALHESERGDGVVLVAEQRIWTAYGLYLARPLQRRYWLKRAALRDAERIVRDVQRAGAPQRAVA